MPTLAEVLINEAADLGKINTLHQDSPFVTELPGMIQQVTCDFMRYNTPLNQSIAKIAADHQYTDDQIQRICEESNNQVYMAKYAAFKGNPEKDVRFDLASVAGVRALMHEKTAMEKTASENSSAFEYIDNNMFALAAANSTPMHKIAANKASAVIGKLRAENTKYANSLTEDMTKIAQTLVSEAILGNDPQPIFAYMCKEAGWTDGLMDICKGAVSHNLDCMKKEGFVSEDFTIDLVNHKRSENYGVGIYGFQKEASFVAFSPIVTRGGAHMPDIGSLVKVAENAVETLQVLAPVQKKLSSMTSIFGLED